MGALIKIVEENEVDGEGQATAPLNLGVPPEPEQIDPRILRALQEAGNRLGALETAIQGLPRAVGYIRALLRSLGARALMFVALVGCLGLAAACALNPSWQGLGIFIAFAVLVYAPLAYLASKGN